MDKVCRGTQKRPRERSLQKTKKKEKKMLQRRGFTNTVSLSRLNNFFIIRFYSCLARQERKKNYLLVFYADDVPSSRTTSDDFTALHFSTEIVCLHMPAAGERGARERGGRGWGVEITERHRTNSLSPQL